MTSPTKALSRRRVTTAVMSVAAVVACLAAAVPADASHPVTKLPTTAQGKVVNASNGNPVAGVLVTFREVGDLTTVAARDRTDAAGMYHVSGLTSDEYAIKFNGSTVGYETGFLACNHSVVQSFEQACTFAPGNEGRARLQH